MMGRTVEAPIVVRVIRSVARRLTSRQFLGFFVGSLAGLIIDLLGFRVLLAAGLVPWLANAISSALAVTAVYLIVTRYSFQVDTAASTYALFFGWYAGMIVLFSFLIQLASSNWGLDPFIWKLLSVPFSFGMNFLFSRFLFTPRTAPVA
jgi:putative flippase GtrA